MTRPGQEMRRDVLIPKADRSGRRLCQISLCAIHLSSSTRPAPFDDMLIKEARPH
jgi:hypothetical protein